MIEPVLERQHIQPPLRVHWIARQVSALAALVTVGVLMELIYVFGFTLPEWMPANIAADVNYGRWSQWLLLLIAFILAFGLYIFAWQITRHVNSNRLVAVIIFGGFLFSITLLPMYPRTSTDIFGYIMQSHVFVDLHKNPYAFPVSAFPNDPLARYIDPSHSWVLSYGPLWLVIYILPTLIAGGSIIGLLWAFKIAAWSSYILCGVLLYLVLKRTALSPTRGLLLFSWNPLVLLELVGNGHNDGWMVAGVLAALLAVTHHRYTTSLVLLTLGGLVKYAVILMLPVLIMWIWWQPWPRSMRLKIIGMGWCISICLVLVFYLPFWSPSSDFIQVLRLTGMYTQSVVWLAGLLLSPIVGIERANRIVSFTAYASFACLYLACLWKARGSQQRLFAALNDSIFWYLAIACFWLQPWYLTWLIPLTSIMPTSPRVRLMFNFCVALETFALLIWTGARYYANV